MREWGLGQYTGCVRRDTVCGSETWGWIHSKTGLRYCEECANWINELSEVRIVIPNEEAIQRQDEVTELLARAVLQEEAELTKRSKARETE